MRLYELAQQGLNSAMGGTGPTGINDPLAPEPAMGAEDPAPPPPEEEVEEMQPVDSALLASVKGLPFVSAWEHSDSSKVHPMRVMAMSLDELTNLRNAIRANLNKHMVTDKVGLWDSDPVRYLNDALEFTERVFSFRKDHGDEQQTGVDEEEPTNPGTGPMVNR